MRWFLSLIVSISQPYVRPIIRGKAGAGTEFGAKVAISVVDGYTFVEKISWDNFNEGNTLQESVESYAKRFGYYPEAVLADTIYRTKGNRNYCKDRGIRLSGPRLGRPTKEKNQEEEAIAKADFGKRNEVEGKFGEGKRCYGLGRIMAHRKDTSECVISMQFIAMNLEHVMRVLCCTFLEILQKSRKKAVLKIKIQKETAAIMVAA